MQIANTDKMQKKIKFKYKSVKLEPNLEYDRPRHF